LKAEEDIEIFEKGALVSDKDFVTCCQEQTSNTGTAKKSGGNSEDDDTDSSLESD
jgi:hypothetical protein